MIEKRMRKSRLRRFFFSHARSTNAQTVFHISKTAQRNQSMAFAFWLPQDVADLIHSMRDWRWDCPLYTSPSPRDS